MREASTFSNLARIITAISFISRMNNGEVEFDACI